MKKTIELDGIRYHALAGGLYAPEGWKEKELSNRLGSTLSDIIKSIPENHLGTFLELIIH